MKKTILIMAILAIVFAIAGCTSDNDSSREASATEVEQTPTTETSPNADEPEETESPEGTESEDSGSRTQEQESPVDLPADIQPVEATLENPAQIGEWVEMKKYSSTDEDYHTAYCRITGIERGEAGQQAVDKFNEESNILYIGEMEDPDLEFCAFTYEVYFPENFPKGEYGITSQRENFSVGGLEGGGVHAKGRTYIGLLCEDTSNIYDEENPVPGDIWQGTGVFAMVKDCNDYLFRSWYQDNGESINYYILGQ